MKKVLLSAVALFAFGFANAQQFKFGVKAGLNLATLKGSAVNSDVTMKAGLHAGGLLEIKFTDKLALQPELLYSMQGAKVVDTGTEAGITFKDEFKRNLDYINIPIVLKYYPVGGFFLEGGPQAGFLISAKSKNTFTETTAGGTVTHISSDTDVKDQYKSVDFSFNLGLGYDFTPNFFAGARYNLGLTNIENQKGNNGAYEADIKNGVLSFSLGYKF